MSKNKIYVILNDDRRLFEDITENLFRIDERIGPFKRIPYEGKQIVTPNLGLVIPAFAESRWGEIMSDNFVKIDQVLGTLLNKEK